MPSPYNKTWTLLIFFSGGILALAILAGSFHLLLTFAEKWQDAEMQQQGDAIIQKIDAFRQKSGCLPASLTEIGESASAQSPFSYQQRGENHYIIWYGKRLGESGLHDSHERGWKITD